MFLHILYSIAVLFSTIAAFAAPSPTAELPKRTSETCGGLNGLDGYFDTSTKFVLSTLNNTLPNASAGGAPLFLRRAGKMGGNEVEVLSSSSPSKANSGFYFSLVNGTLSAIRNTSNNATHTVAIDASSGNEVTFLTSTKPIQSNHIFCAIANTDPHGGGQPFPTLAVGNDPSSWSLCKSKSQNVLVYNATIDNDFKSCYSVTVILKSL